MLRALLDLHLHRAGLPAKRIEGGRASSKRVVGSLTRGSRRRASRSRSASRRRTEVEPAVQSTFSAILVRSGGQRLDQRSIVTVRPRAVGPRYTEQCCSGFLKRRHRRLDQRTWSGSLSVLLPRFSRQSDDVEMLRSTCPFQHQADILPRARGGQSAAVNAITTTIQGGRVRCAAKCARPSDSSRVGSFSAPQSAHDGLRHQSRSPTGLG
jgi:hypothetical protein